MKMVPKETYDMSGKMCSIGNVFLTKHEVPNIKQLVRNIFTHESFKYRSFLCPYWP